MTQLIGQAATTTDEILWADYPLGMRFPRIYMLPDVQSQVPRYRDDCSVYGFQNPYWPGSGNLMTDAGGVAGDIMNGFWFDAPDVVTGHTFGFGFVGISRDQYGSPLGGVTMKLFRASDNTLIDLEVSDTGGNYTLMTPYLEAHYIVAHKTSALVAGATLDNIVPAT